MTEAAHESLSPGDLLERWLAYREEMLAAAGPQPVGTGVRLMAIP